MRNFLKGLMFIAFLFWGFTWQMAEFRFAGYSDNNYVTVFMPVT